MNQIVGHGSMREHIDRRLGGPQRGKEVTLTLRVDTESYRTLLNEVERLTGRVQDLLEANNREVERRRGCEGLLREIAVVFREYAENHRAKANDKRLSHHEQTTRLIKAERNAGFANMIDEFLGGAAA